LSPSLAVGAVMAAHPFLHLAHEGDLIGLKESIEVGDVDVNTREKGLTALHLAASRGHAAVVQFLCGKGADPNVAGDVVGKQEGLDGVTPLGLAAALGHAEVVTTLLDGAADPDRSMARGVTPLTAATAAGHLDVVEALVGRGADLNKVEDDGWSALMLACLHGHESIGKFLAASGADKEVVAKDGTSLANAVVAIRNTDSGV